MIRLLAAALLIATATGCATPNQNAAIECGPGGAVASELLCKLAGGSTEACAASGSGSASLGATGCYAFGRNGGPDKDKDPGARKGDHVIETVYYGTDRQAGGPSSEPVFGTTRADHLTFGKVEVSIPRDHRMGVLETPSIWRFEFREDPAKHVMVLRTSTLDGMAFWASMRHDIQASPRKSVLLFIHGFNVSFVDAARRTAQMAYDLGFDGAPVFFSWPSQGQLSPLAYAADEQAIIDAQPHLAQFLRNVLRQSGADNVYLIAHSMGNRGLARVLASLNASDPSEVKRIKAVILAAPDIGTTEFTEQIAPSLYRLGAPVTLYASSRDNALSASERWHRGARLGEAGVHLVVLDGIETIDASAAGDDLLGHSYYGARTALSDMFYLIRDGLPAGRRCCLRASSLQGRSYWVFMK